MEYLIHFENGSSAYLAHHGVKGMKWGVWNEETKARKTENLEDASVYRLDSWGKSSRTNVLYITGDSGSGKTTIANKLKGKNVNVVHLDSYFDDPNGPKDKAFDRYLERNMPDYKKLSAPADKISLAEWEKTAKQFEKHIEAYGKFQYGNGHKVVVEGTHLLDDTLRADKSFFASKPVIVTRSSALTNAYRAFKRDGTRVTPSTLRNRFLDSRAAAKETKLFIKGASSESKMHKLTQRR